MSEFVTMIGGVVFFLFGMQIAKEGLQQSAGDKLRRFIHKFTQSNLKAMFFGTVVTLVLQSSSASTAMLVGFANAGMITVGRGLLVALGAGVGTSLFVVLLAKALILPLSGFATFLLVSGFVVRQLGHKRNSSIGRTLMGFGFILFGIKMIANMGAFIKANPMLLQQLSEMGQSPMFTILLSTVVTVILQSSTATIGIVISLAYSGAINLETALPIVLGANIGTTSTALLASVSGGEFGKRIATGQLIMKVVGVMVLVPFLSTIESWLSLISQDLTAAIAQSHLLFNIAVAIVFAPFANLMTKGLQHLVPRESYDDQKFQVKYLDNQVLDAPTFAFGNVSREILRMANIVQDMFAMVKTTLKGTDLEAVNRLEDMDDYVDMLNREIKFYLARISQRRLSNQQAERQLQLLMITSNLEEVGDVINRSLGKLIRKKIENHFTFSEEGWNDILGFHNAVLENMKLAITAFTTQNEEIARRVIRQKRKIKTSHEDFQQAHLHRLHDGKRETYATSALHVELMANMLRVSVLVTKLAGAVLHKPDEEDDD